MAFEHIVVDSAVMAGVPCIKGTRIPVATVVGMVADGMTTDEILVDFPQLTREDVREALRYDHAVVPTNHAFSSPQRAVDGARTA